jgi:hypothetical protein
MPSKGDLSDFEANDYAQHLDSTFETGEGVFMSKLRNYCTHYSVLLPALGTTLDFGPGGKGVQQVNTLQLERDKLLRWDGWTAPAKTYLQRQPEHFDLAPIIARYVNSAKEFAAWFGPRSIVGARHSSTRSPPRLWSCTFGRRSISASRTGSMATANHRPVGMVVYGGRQRQVRYSHGTRGFRLWEFIGGEAVLLKDDDWTPLPRYPRIEGT